MSAQPEHTITVDLEPVRGVELAHDDWGANCGPTALAAALGMTMDEVRPAVAPTGIFKGYMGVRDLRLAVVRAGRELARSWSNPAERVDALRVGDELKRQAKRLRWGDRPMLVLVRFHGPWDLVQRAAACYRHAFCYRHCDAPQGREDEQRIHGPGWVLDAGQRTADGAAYWLPARVWSRRALLDLIPDRGTGEVAISWVGEIAP